MTLDIVEILSNNSGLGTGVDPYIRSDVGSLKFSVPQIDAKLYIDEIPAKRFQDKYNRSTATGAPVVRT